MRRTLGSIAFSSMLCFSQAPDAQAPKPAQDSAGMPVEALRTAIGPMMGRMSEAMIEAQLTIADRPETAKRIARFKKRLYDALVKEGFTKREALAMLHQTQLPSGSAPQN